MTTRWSRDSKRNAGATTTHDPTRYLNIGTAAGTVLGLTGDAVGTVAAQPVVETRPSGGALGPRWVTRGRGRINEGVGEAVLYSRVRGAAVGEVETPVLAFGAGVVGAMRGFALGVRNTEHRGVGRGRLRSRARGLAEGEVIESLPIEVVALALLEGSFAGEQRVSL